MNYELRIQINGKWNSLDIAEESPAMIYQMNNLAELKDRQASFSQAIKIPKTRNNIVALGYVNLVDVLSDVAYRLHPCELFARGVKISPVGAVLTILNVDFPKEGYINCQIISGASDLFSSLEQKEGGAIGGDAWRIPWNRTQLADNVRNPDGFINWVNTVYEENALSFIPELSNTTGREVRDMKYFTPSINFDETIRRIFDEEGYDLLTNVGDTNVHISCSDLKDLQTTDADMYKYRGEWIYDSSVLCPSSGPDLTKNVIPINAKTETYQLSYSKAGGFGYALFYPLRPSGIKVIIDIRVLGNLSINNASGRKLKWSIYDGDVEIAGGDVDARPNIPFQHEVDVYTENTNDGIKIYISSYAGSVEPTSFATSVSVSQLRQNKEIPEIGDELDLLECTSFESRRDIVLAYMQVYGASIEVSSVPKYAANGSVTTKGVVRIFNFDKLYQSVSERVDWSSKLVESNQMGFQQGDYAQKNIIKLKDNTEGLVPTDKALFLIQDTTLKGVKELFEIDFATGRSIFYYGGTVDYDTSVIPTYSSDGLEFLGSPTQIFNASNPKVIGVKSNFAIPIELVMDTALMVPIQRRIDNNYQSLHKILNNAKILTLKFNLSIIDIAKLDFYTPVYLEQFGAYFYVNNVSNYVVGNTTTVELIKL